MLNVRKTELFARWFEGLRDRAARVRVQLRIDRLQMENFGDVAPVGDGVSELRIFYGPGYRVYFTSLSGKTVVLLAGGTKATQRADIEKAKVLRKQLE